MPDEIDRRIVRQRRGIISDLRLRRGRVGSEIHRYGLVRARDRNVGDAGEDDEGMRRRREAPEQSNGGHSADTHLEGRFAFRFRF